MLIWKKKTAMSIKQKVKPFRKHKTLTVKLSTKFKTIIFNQKPDQVLLFKKYPDVLYVCELCLKCFSVQGLVFLSPYNCLKN